MLATVVFLIAIELIDVRGMRRILAVRRVEFVVALITAVAVVALGVEQGVVLAVVASMVDHLRHSYDPRSSVLAKSAAGHWQSLPVTAGRRTEPGLVIYRFGSSLYFANTAAFLDDVTALTATAEPPTWFCLDAAAIGDVDYSAAAVLFRVHELLQSRGTRLVVSNLIAPVRRQLDRYGVTAAVGPDAYFATAGEALEAYRTARAAGRRPMTCGYTPAGLPGRRTARSTSDVELDRLQGGQGGARTPLSHRPFGPKYGSLPGA